MSSKQERHGPDGPLNDLTGKAIVNDGPNEREEGNEQAAEPTAERATERAEQVTEPDNERTTDPAAERITDPAVERATDPAVEQVDGQVTEPAVEQVGEQATEPAAEQADAQATETSSERAVEPDGADEAESAPDGPNSDGFESVGSGQPVEPVESDSSDSSDGSNASDESDESDELALRRLLHGAVEELEPSRNALDHLRKAVPARRARRRQAVVGMAAAALFVGTAVPAFVHVANSGSAADARPSIAGHGRDTHGGTGWQKGAEGGRKDAEKPSDKSTSKSDKEKREDKEKGPGKGSSGTGQDRGTGTGGADTSGSVPASAPTCAASQLAVAAAGAQPADAEGKVYGSFRISNVSEMACLIAGRGTVYAQPMGAADPARINVVDHTSGDAAAGLPDPSAETTGLLLEPDMAYEVRFAWVPTETCPTTGTSPDPTPPTQDPATGGTTDGGTGPGPGDGSGADGGGAGGAEGEGEQTGTEPQLGTEDGGTADGSVSLSHTPEAGAPTAVTTIPNACAGTIYRTGVLAAT